MATGDLFTYLSAATADYTAANFAVTPDNIMPISAGFAQKRIKYDDQHVQVLSRASDPQILVGLNFEKVSDTDAATIFDYYVDTNKAWGMARTFQWTHPTDSHIYVARFWSETIEYLFAYLKGFNQLQLLLEGYVAT